MKWHLDVKALEKMSIEELKELDDKLWDERKKVVAILKYKQVMKNDSE